LISDPVIAIQPLVTLTLHLKDESVSVEQSTQKKSRMKNLIILACLVFGLCSCNQNINSKKIFKKGNVIYDFTLSDLSNKFINTGDSSLLPEIVSTEGLSLLYNHANWSGNNVGKLSLKDFAIKIMDRDNNKLNTNLIMRNLQYAMDSIAAIDYPQKFV